MLPPWSRRSVASAQDNPVTQANALAPSRGAVMMGLASGASIACVFSMLKGSAVYLMTSDEAAPSIGRQVPGGEQPWVAGCWPCVERRLLLVASCGVDIFAAPC